MVSASPFSAEFINLLRVFVNISAVEVASSVNTGKLQLSKDIVGIVSVGITGTYDNKLEHVWSSLELSTTHEGYKLFDTFVTSSEGLA